MRDREEKKPHQTCLPCNEPPVLDQQSKISSAVGVIMKKQKNEIWKIRSHGSEGKNHQRNQ